MHSQSEEYIVYNGKSVQKNHFRAFIYHIDGVNRRLVNSWDEFQKFTSSGLWSDEMPVVEKKELNEAQNLQVSTPKAKLKLSKG